ncbi:hypothetical protein TNCV_1065411 [Trichonephila clavipes]|nr:hypothetical protein TNCV_1065411 [Trichonephila clavipes]
MSTGSATGHGTWVLDHRKKDVQCHLIRLTISKSWACTSICNREYWFRRNNLQDIRQHQLYYILGDIFIRSLGSIIPKEQFVAFMHVITDHVLTFLSSVLSTGDDIYQQYNKPCHVNRYTRE